MSPPGNGKTGAGGTASGLSEKLSNQNALNLPETPLPVNVARLKAIGVAFRHRTASKDCVTTCPECGGPKLVIDEEKPFAICFGNGIRECRINKGTPFAAIITGLRLARLK